MRMFSNLINEWREIDRADLGRWLMKLSRGRKCLPPNSYTTEPRVQHDPWHIFFNEYKHSRFLNSGLRISWTSPWFCHRWKDKFYGAFCKYTCKMLWLFYSSHRLIEGVLDNPKVLDQVWVIESKTVAWSIWIVLWEITWFEVWVLLVGCLVVMVIVEWDYRMEGARYCGWMG